MGPVEDPPRGSPASDTARPAKRGLHQFITPYFGLLVSTATVVAGVAVGQVKIAAGDLAVGAAAALLLIILGFFAGHIGYRQLLEADHVRLTERLLAEQAHLQSSLEAAEMRFHNKIRAEVAEIRAMIDEIVDAIGHIPELPHWSAKSPLVEILNSQRIRTDVEAATFEGTIKCQEVWVATRDLVKDLSDSEGVSRSAESDATFETVVACNIREREIKYVYLVRDSPTNRHVITHELQSRYADVQERLEIFLLSDDQWTRMPYCDGDFAIFVGDRSSSRHHVTAHFELPWSNRRLWIETPPMMAHEWAGRVEQIKGQLTPHPPRASQ